MHFDYDSLRCLAAVVRSGSFEIAAVQLNVTQSAVSQRIKALEIKVGSVLILRSRPCTGTDVGLQLVRHFEQVELLQYELGSRLATLVDGIDHKIPSLRISVNNDSVASWFPNVLRRSVHELNAQIEIIPDDQEHTEKRLLSGDSLAVVTETEKPIQGCQRISLGAMEYIAVASRSFFRTFFSEGVNLAALQKAPCIAFDRKDTIQAQWMQQCFGRSVQTRTTMVPSPEGYAACCLNGAGWGLVPAFSCGDHLKTGKFVELVPGERINISLHWQWSTTTSKILCRLGDIVLDEARNHLLPDEYRQ